MKETFTKFQTCNFRRGLVPAVLLFAAACSKDPMTDIAPAGRSLRFDVSQDDGWHTPQSRATIEEAEPTAVQVIPLQDETSVDALFLHVTVTDGIERPASSEDREAPKTRAARVDDMSEYGAFAVNGFTYKGAWDSSLTPDLMNRVEVVEQGNGIWAPASTTYHWPGAGKKVRFFAHAPIGIPNMYDTKMLFVGSSSFDKDILFADSGELDGDTEAPVPLTFKHIMSCVRFVAGDDMKAGKIRSIQFRDVYSKHTFSFETGTWSILNSSDNTGNSTLVANNGGEIEVDGTAGAELCQVFIAPQRFNENTTLYVAFYDAPTSTMRMLTASLAGMELPMGKTVTFRLSTSSVTVEPHLNIGWMNDFPYAGGTHQYSVSSYIDVSSKGLATKHAAAAWKAEFSTDDGQTWTTEKPEWLTSFTSEAAGGYAARSYSATVAALSDGFNYDADVLSAAEAVSGVYDLSTAGGTTAINTANCYVVNAPGSYSFPLVYGNAVKEGVANVPAYTSQGVGTNVLTKFVNHLDTEITDPYIYNNAGCEPSDALVLWCDAEELVTNVALSSDKRSIRFDVPKEHIRSGNALIAVRDAEGTVMWSWHIWVSGYVPGLAPDKDDLHRDKLVTNSERVQYTFMPHYLGWCDDGMEYEGRSVTVRFTQLETGLTQTLTLDQPTSFVFDVQKSRNAPHYQFGRKDPICPSYATTHFGVFCAALKTHWSAEEYEPLATINQGGVSIGTAIRNPNVLYFRGSYTYPSDWNTAQPSYYNLWSADNASTEISDAKVVKTIYDPCPVGYCVPASNAFSGFTYDGCEMQGDWALLNSPDPDAGSIKTHYGIDFYCNPMTGPTSCDPSAGTLFVPYNGYRSGLRGIGSIHSTNIVLSAHPSDQNAAYALMMAATSVKPHYKSTRHYGSSVLPVRER